MLVLCPNCKVTVIPMASGECPACRTVSDSPKSVETNDAVENASRSPTDVCLARGLPDMPSEERSPWHTFFTDRLWAFFLYVVSLLMAIFGCAGYQGMDRLWMWWPVDLFWLRMISLPVVLLIYWFLPLVFTTGIVFGDFEKTQGRIADLAIGAMAISAFTVHMSLQMWSMDYGPLLIVTFGPWAEIISVVFHGIIVCVFYGFIIVRPLVGWFRK